MLICGKSCDEEEKRHDTFNSRRFICFDQVLIHVIDVV